MSVRCFATATCPREIGDSVECAKEVDRAWVANLDEDLLVGESSVRWCSRGHVEGEDGKAEHIAPCGLGRRRGALLGLGLGLVRHTHDASVRVCTCDMTPVYACAHAT